MPEKTLAMDCEMVNVGVYGRNDALARVSIVDEGGKCIFDKYVKPKKKVTDYRTAITGITEHHIKNLAEDFDDVREEVATILKDCILVGHSVDCDLEVLQLSHPEDKIRDTAEYLPFWKYNRNRRPSLKVLARRILGKVIQNGVHDSTEDARTAMRLYLEYKHQWTKK